MVLPGREEEHPALGAGVEKRTAGLGELAEAVGEDRDDRQVPLVGSPQHRLLSGADAWRYQHLATLGKGHETLHLRLDVLSLKATAQLHPSLQRPLQEKVVTQPAQRVTLDCDIPPHSEEVRVLPFHYCASGVVVEVPLESL